MSAFEVFGQSQIATFRQAADVLRRCLQETSVIVKPGISTIELDAFAEKFIRGHKGATPAFKGYHGFPCTLCTSVDDQCVHGIPGPRVLTEGEIVKLDCGVIVGGLYTDACVTVPVGQIKPEVALFMERSKEALETACAIVKPGIRVGDISSTIQKVVEGYGYSPVRGLTGHGLGTTLHQFPDIPNSGKAGTGPVLPANIVIAIEPITAMGGAGIRDGQDGWTISTADGSLSCHFEHTVLVTEDGHEVLA